MRSDIIVHGFLDTFANALFGDSIQVADSEDRINFLDIGLANLRGYYRSQHLSLSLPACEG